MAKRNLSAASDFTQKQYVVRHKKLYQVDFFAPCPDHDCSTSLPIKCSERAKNGDFTNNKEEGTHQMDLCVGGRPASQRGSDFNSNSVQTRVTLLYSGIVARYTSINKLNKK